MKQEQDIQRFLKIREEIYEEIKKINPCITLLQDTTQRFAAQLEELQKLSQITQDHIKSAIKGAALEMAEIASVEFSGKTEEKINVIIAPLDHSIKNARKSIDTSTKAKIKKLVLIAFSATFIMGLISFGGGFFYSKRNTYYLPPDFIRLYALGYDTQKAILKMSPQEKRQFEKFLKK
ncbi:MAG: hypothetical protein BGO67_00405 [Alphaproteobacteria bacterium 41-28]|nr:MAG: hypothetical protein BGO67_00405 [Alphaproteobacteria bacterium 41-28]